MGLFGKKKQRDLVLEGLQGTAVVTSLDSADFWDEHSKYPEDGIRLTDVGVGSYTLRLGLEVRVADGRAPYTVTQKFKVPVKAGYGTHEGATVPIYVDPDDPNRIEINWDGFLAGGKPGETRPLTPDEQRADVHANFPDASRTMMTDGWVKAAQGGQMSRKDFDKAIDGAVEGGMLTAAEADAARAQLS